MGSPNQRPDNGWRRATVIGVLCFASGLIVAGIWIRNTSSSNSVVAAHVPPLAAGPDVLRSRAEAGDAQAQFDVGMKYWNSDGVPRDFTNAATWLRKASDNGLPAAQFKLGLMYCEGVGTPLDQTETTKLWRNAADQGYALAERWVAAETEDHAESLRLYKLAADQGIFGAQLCLSAIYEEGIGVSPNPGEASNWWQTAIATERKAADQGDPEAQERLALEYADGPMVPKDDGEAMQWHERALQEYRKLSEMGDPWAQMSLAQCYADPPVGARNYSEAVKWYRKAAEQGHADAQVELAKCYDYGWGVATNKVEAVRWFRAAGERGYNIVYSILGNAYENGDGVPNDLNEALKWYRLGASQGYAEASEACARIEAQLHGDGAQSATNDKTIDPNAEYNAWAADQVRLGQLAWQNRQERDAVAKSAETIGGEVFQITDGGMLVRYGHVNYDSLLCFVEDYNTPQMVDGALVWQLKVYPIGTYTYTAVSGGSKTVKRYTVSLDKAVEWRRNKP
jgi:TPR repeat protein